MALLALGALTLCLIAALATGMAVWLAALIVISGYVLIAGALASSGRERMRRAGPPVPEHEHPPSQAHHVATRYRWVIDDGHG